jgi:hypothetical protein
MVLEIYERKQLSGSLPGSRESYEAHVRPKRPTTRPRTGRTNFGNRVSGKFS